MIFLSIFLINFDFSGNFAHFSLDENWKNFLKYWKNIEKTDFQIADLYPKPAWIAIYKAMSDAELVDSIHKADMMSLVISSSVSEGVFRRNPKFSELLDRYYHNPEILNLLSEKVHSDEKNSELWKTTIHFMEEIIEKSRYKNFENF